MLTTPTDEKSFFMPDRPYLQKPISLIDTVFDLYGFLPEDDDPRWSFLSRYDDVKHKIGFGAMNFANAWGATYLSDDISYRSGFVNSFNAENNLQLDRALDNIEYTNDVHERYILSEDNYNGVTMQLAQTDCLTTNPHEPKRIITPCPEALYQIRLYDDQYLARVGFNLHEETDSTILSIVNIQGVPGGSKRNHEFEKMFGISPFNILVRRVLSLAGVQNPAYTVRGMINPERGNPQLYWGVLEQESVDMYHAHRKSLKISKV